MNDGYILILLVGVVSVLFLIISKLASFGKHFAEDTRSICYEIDHAKDQQEYRRWRRELHCHYLRLIPFVTEKNVMRMYYLVFYKGDHVAVKEKHKDSFVPLLLPSMLAIGLCLVCVCGMSWAWYTASIQSPTQAMTAAYYEVTVEKVMDGNKSLNADDDGSYKLEEDRPYKVTLLATGTVKQCGGYCLIECGDTKYYTQTFKPTDKITITLTPEKTGSYTFTGIWGSISGVPKDDIIQADTENGTESVTDTSDTSPATDTPAPAVPDKPQNTTSSERQLAPSAPADNKPSDTPGTEAPSKPEESTNESDPGDTDTSSESVPSESESESKPEATPSADEPQETTENLPAKNDD